MPGKLRLKHFKWNGFYAFVSIENDIIIIGYHIIKCNYRVRNNPAWKEKLNIEKVEVKLSEQLLSPYYPHQQCNYYYIYHLMILL